MVDSLLVCTMWFPRHLVAVLLILSCFVSAQNRRTNTAHTRQPASSPTRSAPAAHPNIILITLDTTRADRMGFLGSQRGLTPNLDVLAKQAVIFSRAYS